MALQNNQFWPSQFAKMEEAPPIQIGGSWPPVEFTAGDFSRSARM
jgi:hypothetical protein